MPNTFPQKAEVRRAHSASPGQLASVVRQKTAVVLLRQRRHQLEHVPDALLRRHHARARAHVGLDPAGVQRHEQQALVPQVHRQGLRQHVEGGLAGKDEKGGGLGGGGGWCVCVCVLGWVICECE